VDQSAIGWIALGIAALVFFDLLFVELRRAYREGARIVNRLIAYGDLPIISLVATAGQDAERLGTALEEILDLIARAQAALAVIGSRLRPAPAYSPNGSSSEE